VAAKLAQSLRSGGGFSHSTQPGNEQAMAPPPRAPQRRPVSNRTTSLRRPNRRRVGSADFAWAGTGACQAEAGNVAGSHRRPRGRLGVLKRWGYARQKQCHRGRRPFRFANLIAEMRPSIDGQVSQSSARTWPVGGTPEGIRPGRSGRRPLRPGECGPSSRGPPGLLTSSCFFRDANAGLGRVPREISSPRKPTASPTQAGSSRIEADRQAGCPTWRNLQRIGSAAVKLAGATRSRQNRRRIGQIIHVAEELPQRVALPPAGGHARRSALCPGLVKGGHSGPASSHWLLVGCSYRQGPIRDLVGIRLIASKAVLLRKGPAEFRCRCASGDLWRSHTRRWWLQWPGEQRSS